jgi:antitoxin (DNA-binding transcriptional repressor) of toxin-antitoxin stability system
VHRPNRRGKLSTVGHAAAFRAFARAAERAGVRFMVVGGTFRDVAVRPSSTRDIDIVLVDRKGLPEDTMQEAGFERVPGSPHAWRFARRGTEVELQVAALASSRSLAGPFSVAFKEAVPRRIEGCEVLTPRIEDYVILKLLAANSDVRRRNRDLADVQSTLFAYPELCATTLSIASLRARLRDLYGFKDTKLRRLTAFLRQVPARDNARIDLHIRGLYKDSMKTLTITEAKRNLGSWLSAAARGEDIGIITGADIIALRKVEVDSTDYAQREYGATKEQVEQLNEATDARYRRLKRTGKIVTTTAAELRKMLG